ncbi:MULTISPECIES: CBS domain-containing protein [unclassified Kitasatospora]|uniref:CBS domain-containing protein n=1 Tax=unclassified Kitasatospora TaxID=2633591 RepID=UPI0033D01ED0
MLHRTVRAVMTRDVVTARPDTPFKEIVGLFHRNDITAVPVIDDMDRPIGLVSEADLVRKEAATPDGRQEAPMWMRGGDRDRARAETAGGLMTSPPIVARPEWSIVRAARVMDRQKVKRLPVIDGDGRLVGIVSRSDLLQPFLRPDSEIADEITGDVLGETLWLDHDAVHVAVDDGVVTLTGKVHQKSLIPVVERLCNSVDGVVSVHQTLDYTVDDTEGRPDSPVTRGAFRLHRQ